MQVPTIVIGSSSGKASKPTQVLTNGPITINQLKDLVKEAIKDQVESVTQPLYTYAKLYS